VLVDTGKEHSSAESEGLGLVSQTYIGRFLAIGQQQSLTAARALAQAGNKDNPPAGSLAANGFRQGDVRPAPQTASRSAWAVGDGLRRLLAPQGGVLGAAGVLLDQPGAEGRRHRPGRARQGRADRRRSELDPRSSGRRRSSRSARRCASRCPRACSGTWASRSVDGAEPRARRGRAGRQRGLGALLSRAGRQLDQQSGGRLTREVLAVLQGEVAVTLTPSVPAPVLTVVAHAHKDTAARSRSSRRDRAPARQDRALPAHERRRQARSGAQRGPI